MTDSAAAEFGALEPSVETMRALVDAAVGRLIPYLQSLDEQPAADLDAPEALAATLKEPTPPEHGSELGGLLEELFERAVPKGYNAPGPGYLAYIPGGGLFQAAVAALLADGINRYTGVWEAAPGLVQLEANVLRWLCRLVGYGDSAQGILTSGGSLANLSAVVTARRTRLPENFLNGTLYLSDQTHYSMAKAAVLAGFPKANVRYVPSDERFRIRVDDLEAMLRNDRQRGLTPFMLVANAGTTSTGAVDDLQTLARTARAHELWYHIDAAYGGFFMLTERGRERLAGMDTADSITLDPHKGLFMPFGLGALLTRDGTALRDAHAFDADYLPEMPDDPDRVDFRTISPELSRSYRGLKLWLPLKLAGLSPFRRYLNEKLDLAQWAAERLREIDGIELVAEPQLSLLAFRLVQPGLDDAKTDALNRRLTEAINAPGRVFVTGTLAKGRYAIRICVLCHRTHRAHMEAALEDIRAAVKRVR